MIETYVTSTEWSSLSTLIGILMSLRRSPPLSRYTGVKTPVPSTIPVYNNSNLRYLMPSLDPWDDVFEDRRLKETTPLSEVICKPLSNCSVINSIEYAIKKLYLEEFDPIIEVALSVHCVGKEHGVSDKVCDGLPIAWGFDYIFENGIAFRKFYPHTNYEEQYKEIADEQKYHIDGY
jgi:hypothetical protein